VTTSPARRLVAAYVGVTALLNLSVLLPGNPDYSSGWGLVGSVAIQAAVIWWLWRGSPVAWFIALGFALFTVVSLALFGAFTEEVELSVILVAVFCIAQAGILLARPITDFVWSGREIPAPLN
jgi:hypothetical protein